MGRAGLPWKFKPGALLLAQLSQRPIVPLSYCASRAWKISWDRFVIPKFGARIVIAVGEPVYVAKGLDAAGLESAASRYGTATYAAIREREAALT